MTNRFSDSHDIEFCRKLHREYGTTYYFATMRFPEAIKWRVHALYGFVRIADEWVDNPGNLTLELQRQNLEAWRESMVTGLAGERPEHGVMRAFCDAMQDSGMPVDEAHCFLDAMIMDLDKDRYESYTELQRYMRGSASAIGVLMCYAMGAKLDSQTLERAKVLGEAMQLTNFLRDIREDYDTRSRIYLPLEDMAKFGVTEDDIRNRRLTPEFVNLMKFEIDRARRLYALSDSGIASLPIEVRKPVQLARILYSQILDEIERMDYDVFSRRARTSKIQKLSVAFRVYFDSIPGVLRLFRDASPA